MPDLYHVLSNVYERLVLAASLDKRRRASVDVLLVYTMRCCLLAMCSDLISAEIVLLGVRQH
eukprot:360578-Chlamydomonas_euryale.AAC.20